MRRGISSWPAVTKTVAQQTRAVTDPTLARIGILQQGIGDHEQGEARVRQDIEPNRTLEAGAQTACWRQYAWKCERPRNCDERRQEIAIRQGEECARAQD